MTDIVERLEMLAGANPPNTVTHALREAADEIVQLRKALQWFVDNDNTNEGDEPMPEYGGRTWDELNAYWIDGLNRARALLKGNG